MLPPLSPFQKFVLEEFLLPATQNDVDPSVLLLSLNVYISRLLCHYRVKIVGPSILTYPNLYAILFLRSSMGKDFSQKLLDELFSSVFQKQEEEFRGFKEREIAFLREQAESLITEKKMNKAQMPQFIEMTRSHDLRLKSQDATLEGIASLAESLTKAGFGTLFFNQTEFLDYIETQNETRTSMLSLLKDAYEDGTFELKSTQGTKSARKSKDVPFTLLVHSSLSGLTDDERTMRYFKNFFNRGFARRAFVCYSEKNAEYFPRTTEEKLRFSSLRDKAKPVIAEQLLGFAKEFQFPLAVMSPVKKTIDLSPEAFSLYCEYQEEKRKCFLQLLKEIPEDGLCAEMKDRHRRALRLSACIAAVKPGENFLITREDMGLAIAQTEFFGGHFQELFFRRPTDQVRLIHDEILRKQSGAPVTKMTLRSLHFAPHPNKAARWITDVLHELPELCAENDEVFVSEPYKTNGVQYKILRHADAPSTDIPVILSFSSKTSVEHPVDGYERKETTLKELSPLLQMCAYAPAVFKDGYRKMDNIIEFGNCVIVDVDEGLTFTDAKQILEEKGFSSLLITSRNHGKEKITPTGTVRPPCDRFRIIFPCKELLAPKHGYKAMMKNIFQYLELEKYADEKSMDAARFFFPSPTDAQVSVHHGTKLLNWRMFDTEKMEVRRSIRMPSLATRRGAYTPFPVGPGERHPEMVKKGVFFFRQHAGLPREAAVENTIADLKQWNMEFSHPPIPDADIERFARNWLPKNIS